MKTLVILLSLFVFTSVMAEEVVFRKANEVRSSVEYKGRLFQNTLTLNGFRDLGQINTLRLVS